MNSSGVRPSKLWHWLAVAFLVATFLAEPKASMALTWELFRGAGAIGGELLTGEPEPDVLNLQPDDSRTPDDGPVADDQSNSPEASAVEIDANSIRSVLDAGVTGVVSIHDQVERIQHNGGLTVEIGDQS